MTIDELQDAMDEYGDRLQILSERELRIIKTRMGGNDGKPQTLTKTANDLGVSRELIRLIEEQAVSKLRSAS